MNDIVTFNDQGWRAAPKRLCRAGLSGLFHVRNSRPRAAPYWRWAQARAATYCLCHERAGPQSQRQIQKIWRVPWVM